MNTDPRRLAVPEPIASDRAAFEVVSAWDAGGKVTAMTATGSGLEHNPEVMGQILAAIAECRLIGEGRSWSGLFGVFDQDADGVRPASASGRGDAGNPPFTLIRNEMRYRLRTLLIVAALAPMVIGGPIAIYLSVDRWVKGEYKKVFDEIREQEHAEALRAKQEATNVPLSTPSPADCAGPGAAGAGGGVVRLAGISRIPSPVWSTAGGLLFSSLSLAKRFSKYVAASKEHPTVGAPQCSVSRSATCWG